MADHIVLGEEGEELACAYLMDRGYRIIERNWRYQKAEVDILAERDNTLAVIEVKTRSTRFFGDPVEFVKKKKIQLLVKAVNGYVEEHELDVEVRFDLIGIIKKQRSHEIVHLKDAFYYF